MRRAAIAFFLYVAATDLSSKQSEFPKLTGSYLGRKSPGMTPESLAPGIVSVFGSNENTVTISRDGRELYFGKESEIWVCRWTESG